MSKRKIFDVALRKITMTRLGLYLITPPLYSLSIEPTSSCNLDCVMCYSKKGKNGFMSWSLFTKIIDEIKSRKDIGIGLNFSGESLLHPKFKDMLEYIASRGIQNISLNTNGLLLTPKITETFLNCSKGTMVFSIDGLEETYKKIRIGSNYEKVIRNIEFLLQRRKEKGISKPYAAVNLVKSNQSQQEINDYIAYWIDKVDYVSTVEQLGPDLRIVSKNDVISKQLQKGRMLCLWPWRYLAVCWDGRITLCCHDLEGRAILDVNANEGISKIWGGGEYNNVRWQHFKKDFSSLDLCRSCEAWVATYIPSKLNRLDNGIFVWRKGLSTYYSKRPESLGIKP